MTATWKKTLRSGIRFPLQFPKLKWFSNPIWHHHITVEVKNNLAHVNISRTIYYENGKIFEKFLCKIATAMPLCLHDWDSCNAIRASSANCSKLFHSGKLVLKMILKDDGRSWFGFQVGCQPFSSSNFIRRGSSNNGKSIAPALLQPVFTSSDSLLNA